MRGSQRDHFSHLVGTSCMGTYFCKTPLTYRWLIRFRSMLPSAFRQTKVTFVYACSNYSQVSRVFVLFTIWSLEPPLLLSKSLKRTGENAFVQSLYKRIVVSGNKQIWTAEINHPNFEEGLSFNRSSVSQVKDFNIKTNSMWRQKSMFHVLYGIFSVDKALLVDT